MHMMLIEGEVKPGKKDEFVQTWKGQILPLLKKQAGFVDEILLFEEESQHPCGLSFWKTRVQCERYEQDVFPQSKKFVQHLMHSTPKIRHFEVEASETFKTRARKVA